MKNSKIDRRSLLAASLAAMTVALSAPAWAQGIDYAGETIDFVNFGAPGSPPDVWYRTLIPYLEKHIPGNPSIDVINKPGASSMIAANYTAQAIKNDGFAIGSMNAVAMNKAAGGDPSARFDLREMKMIGAHKLTRVVIAKKDGITGIDDLLGGGTELVMGMESDATPYFDAFFALTGVDARIISSYQRFPDTLQAFRTGEVDAMPMSVIEWKTFGPDLSNDGAIVLWQYGFGENGQVTATDAVDAETGHAIVERANPGGVGSDDWDTMNVQASGQTVSNQIWAPAGTPDEAIEILSQAFVDATSDPEFRALHEKQYGIPAEWTNAAEARAVVDSVLAIYGN